MSAISETLAPGIGDSRIQNPRLAHGEPATRAVDTPAPTGRLSEVAEGVYTFLQPPGSWCLSNAGVIAGPDGVVLVDTVATVGRAEALRQAVAQLGRGPVRTVINTHHHGDHVFGNAQFAPPASIIAHELARPEIAAAGLGLCSLWPQVEWGDVTLRLPEITFTERMTVYLGERPVELHHVGPAHTTNDVVVWVPDAKVLFVGDLALPGCTPFNLMGSIHGSLAALARLRRFDARWVVGGHGPVSGPEVFDQTETYLNWVLETARSGIAEGHDPLTAARRGGYGPFAGLIDPERLVGNLHRAYLELRRPELPLGAELDVLAAFGEMIEFNGGRPLRCLA
jgi:cyclase